MEKLEFAKALGEKIIKSQHEYFVTTKSEDLDHITNLKRIIVAIAEYLKSEIWVDYIFENEKYPR